MSKGESTRYRTPPWSLSIIRTPRCQLPKVGTDMGAGNECTRAKSGSGERRPTRHTLSLRQLNRLWVLVLSLVGPSAAPALADVLTITVSNPTPFVGDVDTITIGGNNPCKKFTVDFADGQTFQSPNNSALP